MRIGLALLGLARLESAHPGSVWLAGLGWLSRNHLPRRAMLMTTSTTAESFVMERLPLQAKLMTTSTTYQVTMASI